MRDNRFETNSTVIKRELRLELDKRKLRCSRCKAHDGDNRGRRPKDDRYKNHRE